MNYPSQIVKLPAEAYEGAIRKYAREGAYIAGDDAKNPWIPFGEAAAIKHFCFDVRTNSVANILWVKGGGASGPTSIAALFLRSRSRDRGPTPRDDWTARPGDFVYELPGAAHTLYSDDPNGMKALFWINGPIEFYDAKESLISRPMSSGSSTITRAIARHGVEINKHVDLTGASSAAIDRKRYVLARNVRRGGEIGHCHWRRERNRARLCGSAGRERRESLRLRPRSGEA